METALCQIVLCDWNRVDTLWDRLRIGGSMSAGGLYVFPAIIQNPAITKPIGLVFALAILMRAVRRKTFVGI